MLPLLPLLLEVTAATPATASLMRQLESHASVVVVGVGVVLGYNSIECVDTAAEWGWGRVSDMSSSLSFLFLSSSPSLQQQKQQQQLSALVVLFVLFLQKHQQLCE
jgi:hypothetical protein